MTSNNMYRVGDFVYFEVSASAPYQIRKIEELNKTSTGAVEAKVVCFYRRRDLSLNLIQLADKHQKEIGLSGNDTELLHQLRHRELFLSRHLETLPATHIRGKCSVTLHTGSEPCQVYLKKDDSFFFQLVYDPVQKTLQADQGTIREGPNYQVDIDPFEPPVEVTTEEKTTSREELRWNPNNGLNGPDIDSYILLARSLATLGRAYYPPTVLRQPSLNMSAAAAARDTTHQFAMDVLHSAGYNIPEALKLLAPNSQPVLKLDEMEEWSASEGNLFEEALEKYGKCFYEIQTDFLPWKRPKSLIEFYYMWKTTDHYIQQKRMKAIEAANHLKQVYIPNYNKPNPSVIYPPPGYAGTTPAPSCCEGCSNTASAQWYALGPANAPLKVCSECWTYWKRYGDLKVSSVLTKVTTDQTGGSNSDPNLSKFDDSKSDCLKPKTDSFPQPLSSAGLAIDSISHSSHGFSTNNKSRSGVNFHFAASMTLRIARRLCLKASPRRQARQPFKCLSLLTILNRDAPPLLSKLDPSETQRIIKWICNSTSVPCSNSRESALNRLIARLFHGKTSCTASPSRDNSPKDGSNSVPMESSSPELILDLAVNGTQKKELAVGQKRQAPSPIEAGLTKKPTPDNAGPEVEQPVTNPKVKTDNTSSINGPPLSCVGPRRRCSMGLDDSGVTTYMYRATASIKRCRRKQFSLSELRRFGRRPWIKVNLGPARPADPVLNGSATKRKTDTVQSSEDKMDNCLSVERTGSETSHFSFKDTKTATKSQ